MRGGRLSNTLISRQRRLATVFIFLSIAALVSSCALLSTSEDNTARQKWEGRRDALMRLEQWHVSARISVRTGHDAATGSLHWRQDKGRYHIRLIAPLGRGTVVLTGDDNEAALRLPDNTVLREGDAEALLQRQLGWPVPVSALMYWIRALPAPSLKTGALLFNERHLLSYLEQSNWRLRYKKYTRTHGRFMPSRLDLEYQQIRIRIAIRRWGFE